MNPVENCGTKFVPPGYGWEKDPADFRDFNPDHPLVQEHLSGLNRLPGTRPERVNLLEYFPPAEDQQSLNSSTACACVQLFSYFERRCFGRTTEPSKLFLYSVTRKLKRVMGIDTGIDIRSTLKSLVRFGAPPEQYWPYQSSRFHEDPVDPFLFAFRDEYAPIIYFRLDQPNSAGHQTLNLLRDFLAAGFPLVFGFPVPDSLQCLEDIDYRPSHDSVRGGQTVLATGYDDTRHTTTRRGALLIRNSWGSQWGRQGSGWLPYDFVVERFAADFWTILKPQWLATGEFSAPQGNHGSHPD